jgi:hypothetical protein
MRLRQKDPEFNVACVRERERKTQTERRPQRTLATPPNSTTLKTNPFTPGPLEDLPDPTTQTTAATKQISLEARSG